jgi:DNA-binding GntR family transcriptional regulator
VVLKQRNISEQAYQHIRDTLLSSGVYVGQKISHQKLGQKLGISNTPLREALFRLAAEGLLDYQNYKGFSIPAISLQEAEEIYESRELIEPYLTTKMARQMTTGELNYFAKIQDEYEDLISKPYHRHRLLIDKKFHMQIATLAGNATLTHTLNQLYDKLIFKSPIYEVSPARAQSAIREHTQIIRALKSRDGKRAARIMRNHIQQQRDYVLKKISVDHENRNLATFIALK